MCLWLIIRLICRRHSIQTYQSLRTGRDTVDAGRLSPPQNRGWLVPALDETTISYYPSARVLSLVTEGDDSLQGNGHLSLACHH